MKLQLPMQPITRNVNELESDAEGRISLFGDPDEPMPYAFRFRLYPGDAGERPHHHAGFEFGTVLEGAVWVAIGERLSRQDAVRVWTGGFIYVPPDMPHAYWSEGEALIEVYGVGPRGPHGFLDEGATPQRR
jgi:mannose-6-phosphate isomerase-like protein (cupin superfamily)